jgi:hypothetical protein
VSYVPVLTGPTSCNASAGTYIQNGKQVHFTASIILTGCGGLTGKGNDYFITLPFAAAKVTIFTLGDAETGGNYYPIYGRTVVGSTSMALYILNADVKFTPLVNDNLKDRFTTSSTINFSGTYQSQ